MDINSGLSTKDAQHAICQGTYGGKEWSTAERQAACRRYDELNGNISAPSPAIIAAFIFIPLVIILSVFIFYRTKRGRKKPKITQNGKRKTNA